MRRSLRRLVRDTRGRGLRQSWRLRAPGEIVPLPSQKLEATEPIHAACRMQKEANEPRDDAGIRRGRLCAGRLRGPTVNAQVRDHSA